MCDSNGTDQLLLLVTSFHSTVQDQAKPRLRRAVHDPVDEILFTTSVRGLMRVDTALVDSIRETMPLKRKAGWTRVLEVGATANDSSKASNAP